MLFHAFLHEAGMATIPTVINLKGVPIYLARKTVRMIPNTFVKKTSKRDDGVWLSHGDAGVSVFQSTLDEIEAHYPRNPFEFLQFFVRPPGDYVRDTRVYTVGGKAVAGVVRRAREPLRPENLTGEVMPTHDQYPSAVYPGPKEPLTGELRDSTFATAEAVIQVLERRIKRSIRSYSPHSVLGFASVDFLLDSDSQPLPVDFDSLGPSVAEFENIPETVAERLGDYLTKLADTGNTKRNVVLMGSPHTQVLQLILKETQKLLGEERVRLQPDTISCAMREGILVPENEEVK